MEPNELVKLLGRRSNDKVVEATLRWFSISRRPQLKVDEDDADGPIAEVQDWVINSRAGIEFGFEDQDSFLGHERFEYGTGPMVLTQIYFYGDHQGVKPYKGQLPFRLDMADDRRTVREKLAEFENMRKSYIRDTWTFSEYKMIVSYVEKDKRIGFIFLMYCPAKSRKLEVVRNMPDVKDIIQALGKEKENSLVRKLFSPFGLYRRLEDQGQEYIADFRENFGFELRFRKHKYRGKKPSIFGLSHLTFYRHQEMDACGYSGKLPNKIKFDDSPEVLMQKIDKPPDNITDELFVGYALWHFVDYTIRVKYSTMENFVLSVDLLAPGIWDAYSS